MTDCANNDRLEQDSLSRAHDEGLRAFRETRRARFGLLVPRNPYQSALYFWAWDLGWRLGERLESECRLGATA